MNSPYYKKSGLPGLSGTHDKASPHKLGFLAALLPAITAVGKKVIGAGKKAAEFVAGKPKLAKAIAGAAVEGKKAADKQIQEVDNSVYSSGKGLSGGIGGMNFNNKRI